MFKLLAGHLAFVAKPLAEPILIYGQLNPWEQTQAEFGWNIMIPIQQNAFENVIFKTSATS